MKKLFILCLSGFISFCVYSQKTTALSSTNDFRNTLSKVIAEAPDQFEKLKTGGYRTFSDSASRHWIANGWKASINIPGALYCFISKEDSFNHSYGAYFGTYSTEAAAKKKLGSLKTQLITCLPGFTIEEHPYMENSFRGFPVNSIFIEKKTDSASPQVITLFVRKDTTVYHTFLVVIGFEYENICDMFKKLESCAANNFMYNTYYRKEDSIINKDGNIAGYGYETDLNISGTQYSYISAEEIGDFSKANRYYKVGIENFRSELTAKEAFENIKSMLSTCLVNYKTLNIPLYSDGYDKSKLLNLFSDFRILDNYQFTQNKQAGKPSSIFLLKLEKDKMEDNKDLFTITLTVTAKGKVDTPKNDSFLNFENIISEITEQFLAPTNISKKLLELLDYSKEGFKAITGEEIAEEKKIYDMFHSEHIFKTDYKLPGAIKTRIKDKFNYLAHEISYVSTLLADSDEAIATALFNDLSKKIKEGLGNQFTYENQSPGYEKMIKRLYIKSNEYKGRSISLIFADADSGSANKKDVYIKVE